MNLNNQQNIQRLESPHFYRDFPLTISACVSTFWNPGHRYKRSNNRHFGFELVIGGEGIFSDGKEEYRLQKGDLFIKHLNTTVDLRVGGLAPLRKRGINISGQIISALVDSFRLNNAKVITLNSPFVLAGGNQEGTLSVNNK